MDVDEESDDGVEFEESRCICNHMPTDHDLDGCAKLDCLCTAGWGW